jgi:3-hydroxyacyl-CoA dehydrogenase / enoyl-CoA hydratase / 3-hydroxybutyryl-CoA epimerase
VEPWSSSEKTNSKSGGAMSIQESIRFTKKEDIGLIEFDLVGEKVNKLSAPIMARFDEVLKEVAASGVKACILMSRKPNIFIAGADIEEIKNLTTKEAFRSAIGQAHGIFNRLEDLKVVTIAAINGACLGGGCEMSLACDYRLASDDKSTRIGLPEIQLGIIPGFGGCVRMPRVIGLQAALDIILAGKSVDAKKALKIGLVDEAIPAALLEKRAFDFAREVIKSGAKKRPKRFAPAGLVNKAMESIVGRGIVFSQAKKMVLKQTKGFYPAPLKALEVIKRTYGYSNRERALEVELEGFLEVGVSIVSKNLISVFFMMESVKKQNGVTDVNVKPHVVSHLGVLGAGVMGGGIGYVSADKGIATRMKDISNDGIAVGLRSAHSLWQRAQQKRRLTDYEYKQRSSHLTGGLDYSGFAQCDVVIEAIVEDMNIKKKTIAEAAAQCKPDCIMATNTSSLSVTEMGKAHPNPKNFLGMHFFNPVHMMPLVEVIRGPQTSDEAVATIFALAKKMGKTPVVVKDGPGFLVNRLLLPYMGEALFLLEAGMSIETVDRYFTHSFGMPMGPFRLMDEVGLDVGMKVLKIFKESLGERIEVSELSKKLTSTGRLGKKNSKGFYLYDEKGKELAVDQTIYKELGLGTATDKLDEKECVERCMLLMVNEASQTLLVDHIASSPGEVDLAMIMGTGFPPFRGGLLKWADTLGSKYIAGELDIYASKYGKRFKPLPALENMAKSERKFYS